MSSVLPEVNSVSKPSSAAKVVVAGVIGSVENPVLVGVGEDVEFSYQKFFGLPVQKLAKSVGADPKKYQVSVLPSADVRLILVGLGEVEEQSQLAGNDELFRVAASEAVRKIATLPEAKSLTVAFSFSVAESSLAVTEGALLASYQFTDYISEPKPAAIATIEVVCASEDEANDVEMAEIICTAVCQVRDWVNTPAADLYPESFAQQAKHYAEAAGVVCEILDEKELAAGGYGGLAAVGRGSVNPPRLVKLSYRPQKATKHLALVGKGITFDTGGLNLKTAPGMYTMKCDMAGAASVLAATVAIAKLGISVQVTAYACLAENMPSGSAYHPSDVLKIRNGMTVENVNCDAEGRLVLSDGICAASEENPDYLVDVATLTGACMVALGNHTTGLMANDDELASLICDAGAETGEAVWRLPLPEYLQDNLRSEIADLKSGADASHGAGALHAAQFLANFVSDGIAWAHLDIAGPAFNNGKANRYLAHGGTGVPVRTLVTLAEFLED